MSYLIVCPNCGHTVCECKELSYEAADRQEHFYEQRKKTEEQVMCPLFFEPGQESGPEGGFPSPCCGPECGFPPPCCSPEGPCCDCPPGPGPEPGACPESGICNKRYAQYGMVGNAPSGNPVEFYKISEAGGAVTLQGSNELRLAAGYVYYVSFVALCTPETNSYFQAVPQIDGTPRLNYGTFATTNGIWRNASAASGFLVFESLEKEVSLQVRLYFPGNTRNIDLSGGITVFPVAVA